MSYCQELLGLLVDKYAVDHAKINAQRQELESQQDIIELKELLLNSKALTDDIFQRALAELSQLDYLPSLSAAESTHEFSNKIPLRYAKRYMFFPLKIHDSHIELAVENPCFFEAIDDISRQFQKKPLLYISNRQSILDLINQAYERKDTHKESIANLDATDTTTVNFEEVEDLLESTDEEPVKRLVNNILWKAAREEASDIHLTPTAKETTVRYRIDGILYQELTIPKSAHMMVVNRIKVMSKLDIAQKSMPQDGRTMVIIAGKKIDIRVSTVPTVNGETIVLRLLYQNEEARSLSDIGLQPTIFERFSKMIESTGGMILVTGPTGSGKTTTLYAGLASLDSDTNNIITVEDPVEYRLPGYSQIEVHTKAGLTFAVALRSVLRQDPDIIMVGEMRDRETAEIAVQSALTGHLVFSTVHTNNAAATITRLIDMGIEPFLAASTIIGILAQRLVRQICKDCKTTYEPTDEQLIEVGLVRIDLEQNNGMLFYGKGCETCRNTGFKGRLGIHELLTMSEGLRRQIVHSNDENFLRNIALDEGMISLRMDGAYKIVQGLTTIEEIVSITREK